MAGREVFRNNPQRHGRPMQARLRLALSLVIIASCGGVALIGGFWVTLTGGLVAHYGEIRELCMNVPSSAADADLSVQLLIVMIVPALIRLLRIGRHIAIGELIIAPLFLYFAVMMLVVMECGDLSRHPPYGTLITWCLAAYPIAAFLMMFVRWPKLILP